MMESKSYQTQAVALIALLAFLSQQTSAEPIASGPNVCMRTVPIKKDIIVEEPIEYVIKYQTSCGLLPCTKTRTETRMDSRIKSTVIETQVPACCSGYAETPDRQCAPICLDSCNNGKCVKPGVCKCNLEPTDTSPGYVGASCNRYVCLASDKWGANCDRECNCPENSYCSGNTGKCLCRAGWRGVNCTEECDTSVNCDSFELPPIQDPEANIVHGSMSSASQNLESSRLGFLKQEQDSSEERHYVAPPVTIYYWYIVLSVSCCCLFMLAMYYRQRLKEIRNEIYFNYSSSTSGSGRNSNDYMAPSIYAYNGSNQNNRPRMPTPPESEYLSKNMSFASATRSIILGKDQGPQLDNKASVLNSRFLTAPKVESHLMASKMKSEKNHYSEMASSPVASSNSSLTNLIPKESVQSFSQPASPENHDYQVPRSPMRRVFLEDSPSDTSSNDLYENDNSSNIYEEIKPRSSDGDKRAH